KPSDEEINTGFITENKQFLHSSNFNDFYNNVKETIQSKEDAFIAKGSHGIFNNVIDMNINMCKYDPLRGASYIKLPKIISDKKAIINIKNKDNKCFLWSILAALHPQDKNSERISKYKEWENEFDEVQRFPDRMSNPGTSLHAGVKVRQGLSMFTPVRYDNPASITASTGGLLLVGPKYLRDDPARPDKTFHKTHQELSLVYLDSRNFKISRPMYVLNLTRQPDNVSGNRNNIILNAEFNEDVPNGTICYICLVSTSE
ncbi:Hypothetical protein CINCED_3A003044, partial [Cinara cedri]